MNPDNIYDLIFTHTNTNKISHMNNSTKINTEADLHSAIKGKNYIIGSWSNGGVSFSTNPALKYTEADARAECKRLAAVTNDKTYFYVRLMGAEKTISQPRIVSI